MKLRKQGIGLLLILSMILSLLPVSAFAAEAAQSLAMTGNDASMGGLITENKQNVSVEWNLKANSRGNSWELASEKRSDGLPILVAKQMGNTGSSPKFTRLNLHPSQECYIVFDYILIGDESDVTEFYAGAVKSKTTGASTSYHGFESTSRTSAQTLPDADNWKTGVVNCTVSDQQYAVIDMSQPGGTVADEGVKGAYISNIRVFTDLPEVYKVHLKFEFKSEHGNLAVKISQNGQAPDYDTGTLAGYADAGKVSGYAMEAMSWAVNTGLVRGVDDTHLAPTNNATRAEVATILMRFCEQMMG